MPRFAIPSASTQAAVRACFGLSQQALARIATQKRPVSIADGPF
ncbi:MAG: hypothetical protein JWP58_271 [Hymenobacter sp.]|nr:hypothetical protein [Hymenobacter sp.]